MSITQEVLDQLLSMKEAAQEILLLDFEDENSLAKLELLQEMQDDARGQIDQIRSRSSVLVKNGLEDIISECIELEMKVKDKLENYRDKVDKTMQELKNAQFIRSKYNVVYAQTEGYFLDQHK
ncbi:hypothetical protein [Paenibacillus aestuarii]|uniref:Flagellar protein FliT n=1 Tax=Paenibacillus aestuarii TaxID=516965 RepID=A0ABW0K7D8_9BACL|nr:hypothetical protein [Paenibacillus aestuarii]